MRKNSFLDFKFDHLWLFNFQFGCRPKSTNHIIFVSAHMISNLKIHLESYWLREFMLRNTFKYFECYTSIVHCESLAPAWARLRPVTPEKFSKHGFSSFHQIIPFSFESRSRWHFVCLIKKTPNSSSNKYFYLKWEKIISHEEELVFEKVLIVESILSQFFIQFWFSCVILTNQIFMSFLFNL